MPKALARRDKKAGGATVDTNPGTRAADARGLARRAGRRVGPPPRPGRRRRHRRRRSARTSTASRASSPRSSPPSARAPGSTPPTSSPTSARPAASRRGTSPTPSTGATSPGAVERLHRLPRPGERHPSWCWPPCTTTCSGCSPSTAPRSGTRRRPPRVLGMKGSTFPAKKALDQARRLGTDEGAARRSKLLARGRPRPARRARTGPTSWCSRCWSPAWRTSPAAGRGARRELSPGSGEGVQLLGQPAVAASGGVRVDDALGGGLVDALLGQTGRGRRRPRRRPRAAATAFFTRVRSSERTALLRS